MPYNQQYYPIPTHSFSIWKERYTQRSFTLSLYCQYFTYQEHHQFCQPIALPALSP